ncbi:hypothetical protein COV20_00360 [Candidatus Woesearchaeota archaeon CG10_big_fil_rev_8_21_14_0_10_45_16]|nr:MAG: hypothetical protein COV20_00360 [Candidatus Woesearchaeota archaeon CG10_big_fil_rev_8_21_14_0_10_45_16]
MGYGVSEKVDAWTTFQPTSLGSLISELKASGVGKVRYVFGWPILVKDKPGHVALLYNDPGRGQDAVTKGQVGNITPLGGKVESEEVEMFGYDAGHIVGGLREMEEHDGPTAEALELFNSFYGLEAKVLASPDGKTLYISGVPVMHFKKVKEGEEYEVELTEEGKSRYNFGGLDGLVVTYAIGLNPVDRVKDGQDKGKPIATAVINVWPVKLWNFIKSLKLGAEANAGGAKGIQSIPIRELGSKYRTTVSNLIALALVGYNKTAYKMITGEDMPDEMPGPHEIKAMQEALYKAGYSMKDIVDMFNKQYPAVEEKAEEEESEEESDEESSEDEESESESSGESSSGGE